ncbi:MAG: LarC family nickel insertion protein [Coriobacteriaceae bacterium]|jgi:uncharacterized protein (DUF111 family)|nr:LarC family nickel insertion protein [Coriobacteriaceae bacterium]
MDTVKLDLSADARRSSILAQLLGLLGNSARASTQDAIDMLNIPEKHHHDLDEVLATIGSLQASEQVKADAASVYHILAQAEAQVHGCPVESTHFHEVGNASTLRSVAAICLAIEVLGHPHISATPVQVGSGKVRCAHGILDIPAPATAAILATGIPLCPKKGEGELCTPTSAAIIKHFVDDFLPMGE